MITLIKLRLGLGINKVNNLSDGAKDAVKLAYHVRQYLVVHPIHVMHLSFFDEHGCIFKTDTRK